MNLTRPSTPSACAAAWAATTSECRCSTPTNCASVRRAPIKQTFPGPAPTSRMRDALVCPSHSVAIAAIATEWLGQTNASRILDVGAGPGKVCLIGALRTEAQFVGVEQRHSLVVAAQAAAQALGVEGRVKFIHACVTTNLIAEFDAMYLY